MLRWALGFLVVAIVAAFMGFGGVASASMQIAKTLTFVFLVFFIIALVAHLISRFRKRSA